MLLVVLVDDVDGCPGAEPPAEDVLERIAAALGIGAAGPYDWAER